MKTYYSDSDIGSVLIGNSDWAFAVPNGYGDGTTTIFVFDDKNEFAEKKENNFHFLASAEGTFNVYGHDCAFGKPNAEVLCTMTGRFAVYYGEQVVAFVRWE